MQDSTEKHGEVGMLNKLLLLLLFYLLIIFNYQNVEKGCLDNLKMLKFLGGACPLEPQTNDISKSFNTHLSLFGNAYNTFLISQQFQFLKQFLSTC